MEHHTIRWVIGLTTPAVLGVAIASGDRLLLLIGLLLSVTTLALAIKVQGENMRSDARAMLTKHSQPASNDSPESEYEAVQNTVIIHGSGHTIINARTVHLGALHAQVKDETGAAE